MDLIIDISRPDIDEIIDRFWETVPPLWGQIRAHIRHIAAEDFEISVEQFHILRHVRMGVDSISELADVKHISRPAISQAVDILVQHGLVTRRQAAIDRRFVRLELTSEGEELLKAIFDRTNRWIVAKFSELSPEELVDLKHSFDILKKIIETLP